MSGGGGGLTGDGWTTHCGKGGLQRRLVRHLEADATTGFRFGVELGVHSPLECCLLAPETLCTLPSTAPCVCSARGLCACRALSWGDLPINTALS